MSKRDLIKSTGIIGLATSLSRVLGFIRDIVIANFFGTALYAQAFVVAFRIPNLLRDLIGEGATNAAFVPVLTEELARKGKKEFFDLAQVLFNIIFWTLVILALLGIFASPLIVRLIAPGFQDDPEKFHVTVTLTRFLFPFLLLVGLWAYAMGILNSLKRFAAPALGPAVLNLSMIVCASSFGENVLGLTAGVLAGGMLQVMMQVPSLYAEGWRFRVTTRFAHPQAARVGIMLLPRVLGSCVYQVNVFISTILASLSSIVGEGAVAALYYANRLWQLPLAIFGIALAQAALPTMSRHVAADDITKLKDTVLFSLRILIFTLFPATAGLMVLSTPIVKALFERGLFTSYSTTITSAALFFYAIGLAGSGGGKVLANVFYSLRDTMTPVKVAVFSVALNIVLNLILMYPMKLGGLALATSISAIFNFIVLYLLLVKKIGDFGVVSLTECASKVAAASLIMASGLYLVAQKVASWNIPNILAIICFGLALFALASYVLKVNELKEMILWISGKR